MTTTFASENPTGEHTTAVLNDSIAANTMPASPALPVGSISARAQDQIPGPGVYAPQPAQAPQECSADRSRTFAITSFVLGIVSVVSGWTFVAPIIGLVLGVIALRRKTAERTLALWGVWLSAAMLAFSVIAAAAGALFIGAGFLAALLTP